MISILETSTWQLKEPKERWKRAINFALSNDYELDNIITKQVIVYQRAGVLITLSRITV